MYVPAHEAVRSHGKGGRASVSATVATALMLVATLASARPAVTRPDPTALPTPATNFVSSGSGSHSTVGNAMTVNQTTNTLGLNWSNFNIGSAASVTFNQPNAQSRVLNRIGDTNPSIIMGQLNANGQVYLINPNGILFGNGAQVNVGGLVASALGVSDDLLNKGLPGVAGTSLGFAWEGDALGFAKGFVAVDPGARITTASGNRVVLLAPKTVENLGLIETGAGGEAILAAGGSVLLTAPSDPNLRGLLVEVKSWKGVDKQGNSVTLDGSVTNKTSSTLLADDGSAIEPDGTPETTPDPLSGTLDAPGGVVTLAALAVNQQGTVRAGKAVNLNGEIMLVAGVTETPRLTVTQTADQAEIDWQSGFNIADGQIVEFVQPTTGAVVYNFINDADRTLADGSLLDQAGRSSIDGVLKANGQLFLINENGFDFGGQADVTAANFVASALGIAPEVVATGLLSQADVTLPAFALKWTDWTPAESETALTLFRQATIDVAAGATIETAENGYAILAGGKVNQAGSITSPGGQVVVAAGAKLYLKPAYASKLRGFTAEVDPLYVKDGTVKTPLSRDSDANRVSNSGTISVPFGNISLVGHVIEQRGQLLSSTSATRNGSIRLMARDLVVDLTNRVIEDGEIGTVDVQKTSTSTAETFVFGSTGGELTFFAGSTTEIALDGSDQQTITRQQSFIPSFIEGRAAWIHLEGDTAEASGANLTARSGSIQLSAAATFDRSNGLSVDSVQPLVKSATAPTDSGIFVGSGATLDVSGVTASKSVADLFIEVELRGDEFADNPVQRDGELRGETAWVDSRDEVEIADLSGYLAKVGQTLEERAATGGSIVLRTGGSLIVKQDALLDVSGGQIDYAAATVKESKAVAYTGKAYRLNDAASDLAYAGLLTSSRNEAAYSEGKSAGTVELTGHSIALDGTLRAHTVRGERQRNLGDASLDIYAIPNGGKLVVRDAGQHYSPVGFDLGSSTDADKDLAYSQGQIVFVADAADSAEGLSYGDVAGPRLELSQSLLDAGFSSFDLSSDGRIEIPDGVALNLAEGGSFKASGRQVVVGGDITAPSGSISLTTRDLSLVAGFPSEAKYSTLIVETTATLSTAGRWINDVLDFDPALQAPKALDGGSITLNSAYDVRLQAGSHLNVSGGARLKSDGALEAGDAGSIKLTSGRFGLVDATYAQDSSIFLDGELSAYALGVGGTLEINTSQIRFGQPVAENFAERDREARLALANPDSAQDLRVGAMNLEADFLDRGGFNAFKFTGRDGLTVAEGVTLGPQPVSWSLEGVKGLSLQKTGEDLADFVQALTFASELRAAPTSLTLATRSVLFGDLTIGEGAHLQVDPQGSIELEGWRQLTMLGTLEARGGSIRLTRPATTKDHANEGMAYSAEQQSRSIFLGENSRLLAGGVTRLDASTRIALDDGQSADALRALGQYRGEVLAGGEVELDAGQGYLITRPGALIDVSGTQDTLSQVAAGGLGNVYRTLLVGSSGGTLSLSARDGMFLDGAYLAGAGTGATDGVFSLRFNDNYGWNLEGAQQEEHPELLESRRLTLYQSTDEHTELWPEGLSESEYLAGQANIDSVAYNGQARLDLATLEAGGFGSWYLQSLGEIGFEGAIDVTVNNQLRLDSPNFVARSDATNVQLSAAAIQIGNFGAQTKGGNWVFADPALGAGHFTATARDIGLTGNFAWSGFGETTLTSHGELHLDSVAYSGLLDSGATGNVFNGGLRGTGDLTLAAARVSPSTYSNFIVDLSSDPAATLRIGHAEGEEALGPQLSAGGKLEFKAANIEHSGLISAPLGQVLFSAPGGTVTLGETSVTSVAGVTTTPLGQTSQSGRVWEFNASGLNPEDGALSNLLIIVTAPEKSVRIDADNSLVETGATIDLSGGGEAVAWEFSPGPGGKTDVLAWNAGHEPNTFVILPNWSGNFAPSDSQTQTGYNVSNVRTLASGSKSYSAIPSLKPGDQIELADNPSGLSGRYTLLPASYALLEGAILVTVKPTQNNVTGSSKTQADGSWLVAGTRLAADVDGSYTAYSQAALTLELAPKAVVQDRARYIETTASGYFYDQAGVQLPGDAGRLAVVGRNTLGFDPVVLGQRASQVASADGRNRASRGVELDLAAPKIEVVDAGTQASGAGWSSIDKDRLNELGAFSLLLGGLRTVDGETTAIETIASEVRIATSGNDIAADALQGPELLLTASSDVTIAAGSLLAANADVPTQNFVLDGDGAFLRVAGGTQASVERQGSLSRSQGDLNLEQGAVLSGRSLILDATHDNLLDGTLQLFNLGATTGGGALSISANRINLIGDSSQPADGMSLDNASIAGFGDLDQLRLTSYSTLDLYGPAVLGTASLKEMVIAAAGIAGHADTGVTAQILAENVRFENPNPETAAFVPGAALGDGKLQVQAQTLTFGDNATEAMRAAEQAGFALRGFAEVELAASQELRFEGVAVTAVDNLGGSGQPASLTLDAGRVVAASAADHLFIASGAGEIKGGANTTVSTDMGGSLALRADSLDISGRVLAPAGSLSFTATGANQAVTLQDGALVSAEGVAVAFADTWAYAPGGKVVLESKLGDVRLESGALVSVSANAAGGDAGQVSLLAETGTVSAAAGTLRGTAVEDAEQGELRVDAATLDVNQLVLAARENTAAGATVNHFGGLWDLRRRSGDLLLTDSVQARQVRFATDDGDIRIGTATATGKIDASGAKGGEIELYANHGNVVLGERGQLLARAEEVVENLSNAGTRGRGGRVTLGASGVDGKVVTLAGSLIDVGVAEGSAAQGGKIIFRADAPTDFADIASRDDLNIQLAGAIQGAASVNAELVSHYTGTSLNAGASSGMTLGLSSIKTDLDAAYSAENMATLREYLGLNEAIHHVTPGVEIATPEGFDDFSIDADLDLMPLRFQGEAGVLTIRAAGDLNVNASISDGFEKITVGSVTIKSVDRDASIAKSGSSWGYRLVAGADTVAADPLEVMAASASGDSGDIVVAAGKLIRTGTGDIALTAGRDITLKADTTLKNGAVIYTAGVDSTSDPVGFSRAFMSGSNVSLSKLKFYFPVEGGGLSAQAGRNISMESLGQDDSGQIKDWLVRYADTGKNPQWLPRIASFREGFAVFGGGDLDLSAGESLTNVTAVIPTNGRIPLVDNVLRADLAVINGGGDLRVSAGDSINGGTFYAETGSLLLQARNSLTEGVKIALGNTAVRVVTGSEMHIESILNPLFVLPAYKDSKGVGISFILSASSSASLARMGTYGADSSIDLLAVAGDMVVAGGEAGEPAPSQMHIAALLGDVDATVYQAPGENGQLDILAGGGITMHGLVQYDIDQSDLPTIANPLSGKSGTVNPFTVTAPISKHTADFWHLNDAEASRLIAQSGDISGPADQSDLILEFNEAVQVEAAGSFSYLGLISQHISDDDVTRIEVGGSIEMPTAPPGTNVQAVIQVNGPGSLEVIAGADIDLSNSVGIVTRGNLENPYLPEGGASILVLAGATPDYAGLRDFLDVGDEVGETALRDRFYNYLRDQGRKALAGGGEASYEKARKAILALFPASSISGGDIEFFNSQIKTEQGGGIDLLAPGGGVTVGIANPDKTLDKDAGNLGLFTIRGGDIRALVRDDFLVNQSRVFTLDGGDILIWADQGSIDAGSGAKTVSATPPPVLVIRNGQVVLDSSNSVAGSGIGALASRADTPASDLDLFAPQGAIDAGDAGLRSTGNVFLGATTILNSANIQVGGVATGVPPASGGIAGLGGVSSTNETSTASDDVSKSLGENTAKNDQAAQELKQALAGFKPSFITVEVLGYGDGATSACEQDDTECKRREAAQRGGGLQGA
jgi:filamentous hemagglutinin family protein